MSGKVSHDDKARANRIVTKFAKKGVKTILLACTDLQLIIKNHPEVKILDTMQILAKVSAERILS